MTVITITGQHVVAYYAATGGATPNAWEVINALYVRLSQAEGVEWQPDPLNAQSKAYSVTFTGGAVVTVTDQLDDSGQPWGVAVTIYADDEAVELAAPTVAELWPPLAEKLGEFLSGSA